MSAEYITRGKNRVGSNVVTVVANAHVQPDGFGDRYLASVRVAPNGWYNTPASTHGMTYSYPLATRFLSVKMSQPAKIFLDQACRAGPARKNGNIVESFSMDK